jgi:hypothetical protein
MVRCPPSRYVHQALREAVTLDYEGHRTWVSDVWGALAQEARDLVFPAHPELMHEDIIGDLKKALREALQHQLILQTENASRLYLLHGMRL